MSLEHPRNESLNGMLARMLGVTRWKRFKKHSAGLLCLGFPQIQFSVVFPNAAPLLTLTSIAQPFVIQPEVGYTTCPAGTRSAPVKPRINGVLAQSSHFIEGIPYTARHEIAQRPKEATSSFRCGSGAPPLALIECRTGALT